MGMQIARKLAESGEHEVLAHNRSREPLEQAEAYGAHSCSTKEEVLAGFIDSEQVIIWVMLPSEIADDEILAWTEILPGGSIIVNGGNSDYRATRNLNEKVSSAGMTLVDIGVSGGIWGYDQGFPMMCGCDHPEKFDLLRPALDTLAQPGGAYELFGSSGAGHYVKMVHNAIEYGIMQSLGEGYQLLKEGPYDAIDLAKAGDVWQHHSVITSWLNELSRQALSENPGLEGITGYVAESGEARWALETAAAYNISVPSIRAAFDVRIASQNGETSFATKVVAAQRNKFGGHNLNGEGAA
jgi:6-phosphogluconate dehydrogenase